MFSEVKVCSKKNESQKSTLVLFFNFEFIKGFRFLLRLAAFQRTNAQARSHCHAQPYMCSTPTPTPTHSHILSYSLSLTRTHTHAHSLSPFQMDFKAPASTSCCSLCSNKLCLSFAHSLHFGLDGASKSQKFPSDSLIYRNGLASSVSSMILN